MLSDHQELQRVLGTAVAAVLRQSRHRHELTQAALAQRTGGVVSKAALANYEAGHRSMRIETFCAIARALDEDPGVILAAAERAAGLVGGAMTGVEPITVDVGAVWENDDPRLAPVRRWFATRLHAGGSRPDARAVTLDVAAVAALADLIGVTSAECRMILQNADGAPRPDVAAGTAS